MSKIQALIFDFDGLILNTERAVYQSWQELYRNYGQELLLTDWVTIVGTSDTDSAFSPQARLIELVEDIDWEVAATWRREREAELIALEEAMPGVREALQDGQRLGLKIALATSAGRAWITRHLTRLGLLQYFDCIHTKEEVAQTKPNPALFLHALECMGVLPDQAVVFEDSPNGIRAAKAAGIFTVGVPTAVTKAFVDGLADLELESLDQMRLEEILQIAEDLSGRMIH